MKEEQIASGEPSGSHDRPSPSGGVNTVESRLTFSQVFGVPEFRALWTAQILSVAGDQLARVAITLLVFSQTGLWVLAAVAFAASIVPTFVGGLLLSGLADRWPRQQVIIAANSAAP